MVNWTEWITTSGLGNNAVLPATSAANFYLGPYVATAGVFINPMNAGTGSDLTGDSNWNAFSFTSFAGGSIPNDQVSGSVGNAIYYANKPGLFLDSTLITVDSTVIMNQVQNKINENNAYNSAKSSYDTKKTTYNAAVTDEEARMKDFFKATFEPKIAIPTRPDPPSQPYAYVGPVLAFNDAVASGATWKATAALQGSNAFLATSTKLPVAGSATRSGYLYSSADTTAKTVAQCGHVFGRLGQGDMSLPAKTSAFYYATLATADKASMQLSFFPTVDADTGLDADTKYVKGDATVQSWMNLGQYGQPGRPAAAEAPMDAGAKHISAGIAAIALVAASMY